MKTAGMSAATSAPSLDRELAAIVGEGHVRGTEFEINGIVPAAVVHPGSPEEVGAILPMHVLLIHQLQIGFMDQRGRLQRMSGPLAPQVARRLLSQLLINQREQCVEGFLVAFAPAD